jgi:hypothetical protein
LELKRSGFTNDDISMAKMILSYLIKNPEAKDTIQGIAKWWLLNEKIDQTLNNILNAMNFLTIQNLVHENNFRNDCISYQINEDELDRIRDLIGDEAMRSVTYRNQEKSVHNTN